MRREARAAAQRRARAASRARARTTQSDPGGARVRHVCPASSVVHRARAGRVQLYRIFVLHTSILAPGEVRVFSIEVRRPGGAAGVGRRRVPSSEGPGVEVISPAIAPALSTMQTQATTGLTMMALGLSCSHALAPPTKPNLIFALIDDFGALGSGQQSRRTGRVFSVQLGG
eukprot:COSAG03_NODE_275_length_9561_cov_4.812408_7_plen_172_part_00